MRRSLALLLPVLLAAALPVLAITCLVIRADSPGSAIYRQVRVGRDGRHFTMFKLRTMYTDADRQRAALLGHNESDGVPDTTDKCRAGVGRDVARLAARRAARRSPSPLSGSLKRCT